MTLEITTPEVVNKTYKHPKSTPITEHLLSVQLKKTTENAGKLECWKCEIITHTIRTMTVARWGNDPETGEQLWQVWMDTFDLCRIKYIEQLGALAYGMNGKRLG